MHRALLLKLTTSLHLILPQVGLYFETRPQRLLKGFILQRNHNVGDAWDNGTRR